MAIMGGACLILGKGESSSFKIFFIGAFGCLAMALCMPKFGGKATLVVLKIFIGAFGDVLDKAIMSAD